MCIGKIPTSHRLIIGSPIPDKTGKNWIQYDTQDIFTLLHLFSLTYCLQKSKFCKTGCDAYNEIFGSHNQGNVCMHHTDRHSKKFRKKKFSLAFIASTVCLGFSATSVVKAWWEKSMYGHKHIDNNFQFPIGRHISMQPTLILWKIHISPLSLVRLTATTSTSLTSHLCEEYITNKQISCWDVQSQHHSSSQDRGEFIKCHSFHFQNWNQ